MKIKYQIFISSTFEDLKEERAQLIKCILEMGHIPVGMEMFSAGNEEQWKIIQRQIDDCDYYIVILAHRYGSMDGLISYTEKEYDYAINRKIPVMGFIIDESVKWDPKHIDTEILLQENLNKFKNKVTSKMVNFWKSTEDLYAKAAIAISKSIGTYERPGYIRASEAADKDVYKEIARLSTENSELRKNISEKELLINTSIEEKEKELVLVLKNTVKKIPIKFRGQTEWNRDFELSYLILFESIGHYLIVEASEKKISQAIALAASNRTDYMTDFPIPTNRLAEWLSDLFSLGLIQPSSKKHLLNDLEKYWSLTEKGTQILTDLRKIKIYSGIAKSEEELKLQEKDTE